MIYLTIYLVIYLVIYVAIYLVIGCRLPTAGSRLPLPRFPVGLDRQFGANQRPKAGTACGLVKTGGAVHTVLIQQGQRRVAERRRALDERFGQ